MVRDGTIMSNKSSRQLNDWDVWEQMLELIKEQVTRTGFNTWFKPVEYVKVDHQLGILRLASSDDMVNSVLNNRYREMLDRAAAGVMGEPYRVIIDMEYMGQEVGRRILAGETYSAESASRPVAGTSSAEPTGEGLKATPITLPNEDHDPCLMSQYRFDNFVVGETNKLAHGIALQVAKSPSLAFNPLFIYSNSGLGKTHLMHAIGNSVVQHFPQKKVLYVSSEEFASDLRESLRSGDRGRIQTFKRKYRSVDILLIDDIQFLEGKTSTQEEFFHVFNELYNKSKQIVICSDKEPAALTELEERLRSRLQWNMVIGIENPDFGTRVAILKSKAQEKNVQMTEPVIRALEMVAANIKNIRELEGALSRLVGFSAVLEREISPELVRDTLTDIIKLEKRTITSVDIKNAVSQEFGIKPADLESSKRSKEIVLPRHVAMYLCREVAGLSYKQIGKEFGKRNHTTVMAACEKMAKELQENQELGELVDKIEI